MLMQNTAVAMSAAIVFWALSCTRNTVHPNVATVSLPDNSYMDLVAGGRLRITVPVLNSGGYQPGTHSPQENGNTITLSASGLTGYEVSYYSIEGHSHGRVRLRFTSAEITRSGTKTEETIAPALPFPLPRTAEHIRLIYLVRKSAADHNMAIVASQHRAALEVFTDRVKDSPDICKGDGVVFCSWVPSGIAVRPE